MQSEDTRPSEESARVLRFARKNSAASRRSFFPRIPPFEQTPVEDVGKYAHDRPDQSDDYRRRMRNNVLALAFVAVLVVCGFWIADTIAQMRHDQDCVLSGRRGCTPVDVPVTSRY
jgi:hypothetical protein